MPSLYNALRNIKPRLAEHKQITVIFKESPILTVISADTFEKEFLRNLEELSSLMYTMPVIAPPLGLLGKNQNTVSLFEVIRDGIIESAHQPVS